MIKLSTNDSQVGGKFDRIEVRGKNVTIKDVTVEGEGIALYSNYNCSGLVVEDSTFISHSNNAVKIIADNIGGIVENVVFRNCKFIGGRMAVEIQNHKNTDYKINGVRFEGCEFVVAEPQPTVKNEYPYGLSLSGYGRNVVVDGCKFEGCGKGIEIAGFSEVTIGNCDISGKSFSVISSNKRAMEKITIKDSRIKGMVRLTISSNSLLEANTIECSYVEIKSSHNVSILKNNITSTGNYSVMLNQSSKCLVEHNNLVQKGSNYSIVRAYKLKSTGNITRNNNLMMKYPKVGTWYDQIEGAAGNVFTDNKKSFIKDKENGSKK